MKNYLHLKNIKFFLRDYIFIILTATIFLFCTFTKSFSEESVFVVNDIKTKGIVDLNFSREKYLKKAFLDSFDTLMTKILLTRDLQKINKTDLNQVEKLIESFQILEESYSKNEYNINIKVSYNETKVKEFLSKKNISFSQPETISAVFYPVFFINDEIQNFNENYFYKNWENIKIKNEVINFILPLEDLEDVSEIVKMKNKIEKLEIDNFVNKYNVNNYVFALMNYQDKKLDIHLKTNFNNNKISKNISYNIININDQSILNSTLKDLKLRITDLWKEENLINLLMPLSIKLKFQHKNLNNLDDLRFTFNKIDIINNYTLEEFNINNSFFKIYYYGDPKKLKSELSKFGYQLKNNQGFWQLYLNE